MPKESSNILQYNQGEKSLWMPFIIYASTESLLEKIPEKSSKTQITQHTPWGFSFSQTVHLVAIKINAVFTEALIA